MTTEKHFYLICFDIVDDTIRTKVAKILEGYGDLVQKSVFECPLDDKQLKTLKDKFGDLIDLEEDSVHFYRLCKRCLSSFECIGIEHKPETEMFAIV